jgi:hypothetical protein
MNAHYPGSVKMTFGKYLGLSLEEILERDPRYLDWLTTIDITVPVLRDAVIKMAELHSVAIQAAVDSGGRSGVVADAVIRKKTYKLICCADGKGLGTFSGGFLIEKEHHKQFKVPCTSPEDAVEYAQSVAESEFAVLEIGPGVLA